MLAPYRGAHDRHPAGAYLSQFEKINDFSKKNDFSTNTELYTSMPILVPSGQPQFWVRVCGH